jgi:hypothetical protein
MEWTDIVADRMRRKRQILFSGDDALLLELAAMLDALPRRAAVLWALEMAEETAVILEAKYPGDARARAALDMTRLWAAGKIKMPAAKRAILDCHGAAKETACAEDAAHYHALGQALSVVHTVRHAMGYPIYDLTAIVRKLGMGDCKKPVEARIVHYADRAAHWREHYAESAGEWAKFL